MFSSGLGSPAQRTVASRRVRPEVELLEARDVPSAASLQVASGIVNNTEHYTNFITEQYHKYLDRAPDASGLAGFVTAMQEGQSPEMIEARFVSSAEYILAQGNNFNGWLTGLYEDVLGRAPDTNGLNAWTNLLLTGGDLLEVALGFSNSLERRAAEITGNYLNYLGRPPEAGAVDFWLGVFDQGSSRSAIASQFVGSEEFLGGQQDDPTAFVQAVYQKILNRTPNPSEINGWVSMFSASQG